MLAGMRLVLSLALLVACSDPPAPPAGGYTIRALGTQGGLLEVAVVSQCLGIEGRIFSEAVQETLSVPASGSAVPLELAAGAHGIAARVIDPMCRVIAFTCIDVTLAHDGGEEFTLELQSVPASASICEASERCNGGRCLPTGPPVPDAGSDAPSPDAGHDAGPVCGPGEHLDCFRDRFCVDGVVGEIVHAPQPCDARECPWFVVGKCPGACGTRRPLDEWTSWEVFCDGSEERIVGDVCATDADCDPPAPVGGTRVHLGCDVESSLCQEVAPPELLDLGAPCSLDFESVGGPGSYGVATDDTCSRGLCRFYRPLDQCAQHGCGVPCEDDWDCPAEYECDLARDWSAETDTRVHVCLPQPAWMLELSCHNE